jgi:TolB-like protein
VQFRFEDHVLDIDRRELRRGAQQIAVGPQVFDLLIYLVQNRERVVTKDDLLDAIWSGRFVSESNLTTRINAARKAIGDTGEEQRLIRTVPRKGFRFVGVVTCEAENVKDVPGSTATTPKPLPLPDKPSIAVLPFDNMSGDPEQEYFADGMVDEIITALSRFRSLFVIARNSTFTYKGRSVDVKQAGRELGVRYVLEGGVRKAANRVRIIGQLIDTTTGAHIWADRFEGGLEDAFDLQDRVTASVVGAIAPKLEQAEIERAKREPTESLDAYDYYLRGLASTRHWSKEANGEALHMFYKAIELDPDFASAHGMAAWCHCQRKAFRWVTNRSQEIADTTRLARRAVELGRDDAVALGTGGWALALVVGDLDDAAAFIDRALALNPNLAMTWQFSGWVRVWLGEPEVAVEHFARAMRLNPLDPLTFVAQGGTAFAYFFNGCYDEALSWAQKAVRERPNWPDGQRLVAAAAALSGRSKEAQQAIARMREMDPNWRLSNVRKTALFRRPEDHAKYVEALRKAGLPE